MKVILSGTNWSHHELTWLTSSRILAFFRLSRPQKERQTGRRWPKKHKVPKYPKNTRQNVPKYHTPTRNFDVPEIENVFLKADYIIKVRKKILTMTYICTELWAFFTYNEFRLRSPAAGCHHRGGRRVGCLGAVRGPNCSPPIGDAGLTTVQPHNHLFFSWHMRAHLCHVIHHNTRFVFFKFLFCRWRETEPKFSSRSAKTLQPC